MWVLSAVAFPAVNVVDAENYCDMRSWVGDMVNIFPQSLDAVALGARWKTMIEGASLLQSHRGSKSLKQLWANAGSL